MEQELAYSFHLGSDKNKSKVAKKVSKGNVSGSTSLSNNAIQNANDLINAENIKTDVVLQSGIAQITSENETGTATVNNTAIIKSQQWIAAAAAITAAQAFIQLKMAVSELTTKSFIAIFFQFQTFFYKQAKWTEK